MNLSIIKAKNEHIDFYYNWVNQEDSLNNKLNTNKKIVYSDHKKWFQERINDKNTHLLIIKYNTDYIGQIRFQKVQQLYYDIDIFIINTYRSKNIASIALKSSLQKFKKRPIRAIVKKSNIISYSFFLKNDFELDYQNKDYWQLLKNR